MEYCKRKRSPFKSFIIKAPSLQKKEEEKYFLNLKPFTQFPRLEFDKVKVGSSKLLNLTVHNPLPLPQYVHVEKLPFDKGFTVDKTEFDVPASQSVCLQVVWKPEKSLGCREIIMFKSSAGLKSQAYLHGIAISPPRQKKKNPLNSKATFQSNISSLQYKTNSVSADEGKENHNFVNIGTNNASHLLSAAALYDSPHRRQTYFINSMINESNIGTQGFSPSQEKNSTASFNFSKIDTFIDSKVDDSKLFNDSLESPPKYEDSCIYNQTNQLEYATSKPDVSDIFHCDRPCLESFESQSFQFQRSDKVSHNMPLKPVCLNSSLMPSTFNAVRETQNFSSVAFDIVSDHSKMARMSPTKMLSLKRQTFVIPQKNCKASLPVKDKFKCHNRSSKVKKSPFVRKRLKLSKPDLNEVYLKNPFATQNEFYDEYWKEKQESAFTNWLNFILTPNDEFHSSEDIQVNSAEIWIESLKDTAPIQAPTKEELSFKTYTAIKQMNLLRRAACTLYQSDQMASVIQKIEREVDLKKICVRSDRAIHADLGVKKDLLEMLLSYNSLWLRVGLETVYGEMINLQNNRDVIGLSRFIIRKFLSDPAIAAKYACSNVRNYYKPGYETSIKGFIIKKFILLVYFLDVAKQSHLIDHNPCLFCKTAKYKSSRELLVTFSREYLSGEGDITRHLRFLGCVVKHEQQPIEEFDFSIKNIAVDLRCGLRLGKVVELLLQDWSISKNLRLNTLNRLAKIHNYSVILKALEAAEINIDGNIDARDIVDGNRERTLSFLWQIIYKTQVLKKIDLKILNREVSNLRENLQLKADFASLEALRLTSDPSVNPELDCLNSKLYEGNEVIQQLLNWCHHVCAHYSVKVYNFRSSFSDGRALCLLLHHYLPNVLPLAVIKMDTTSSYFLETDEECHFQDRHMISITRDGLLQNEKENLDNVLQKLQEIGQIPILSFPPNTQPDDKVIILFVSSIYIRLMELSVETRAGRAFLLAYRRRKLKQQQEKLKIQIKSILLIQQCVRNFLDRRRQIKEEWAAIVFQKFYRRYCAKKKFAYLKRRKNKEFLNRNAVVIQAAFRGYKVRKYISKCLYSATIIQSHIRGWLMRRSYLKLKCSTSKIQILYRAKLAGRQQRINYLKLRKTVIQLQAKTRGILARRNLAQRHSAAVVLQSYVKMFRQRKRYLEAKRACICLQRAYRSVLLTRQFVWEYLLMKKSAIIIQRWYVRQQRLRLEKRSAVKIQSYFRMVRQKNQYVALLSNIVKIQVKWKAVLKAKNKRVEFLKLKNSVLLAQSLVRMKRCLKSFQKKRFAALVIQKNARKMIARKNFLLLKEKTVIIQRWWINLMIGSQIRKKFLAYKKAVSIIKNYRTGKSQRKEFLKLKITTIKMQALYRGWKCRTILSRQNQAATIIQKHIKGWLGQQSYLRLKSATSKLQSIYRAKLASREQRNNYLKLRKTVIQLQARTRGILARRNLDKKKTAAVVLQSYIKMFQQKKRYLETKRACICLQRTYRSVLLTRQAVNEYLLLKKSAIIIQRWYLKQQRLRLEQRSAIKIQSYFRMVRQKNQYVTLHSNVVKIQIKWKALLKARKERMEYLRLKRCSLLVQSLVRMKHCQRTFQKKRRAAILIQKNVRKLIARKNYLSLKEKTVLIQRWWINLKTGSQIRKEFLNFKKAVSTIENHRVGKSQRENFLKIKCTTIKMQALYRGFKCRKVLSRQNQAATIIQKHVKGCLGQKSYKRLKLATSKVQSIYKAKLAGREQRNHYLKLRKTVIQLQARTRGILSRRNLAKRNTAAVVLQSYVKMFRQRKQYLETKKAAICLQRTFRSVLLTKQAVREYLLLKKSAIIIQRWYLRRQRLRLEERSAVKIQSYFRMVRQKNQYVTLLSNVVKVQIKWKALLKARKERREYLHLKTSTLLVQSLVRMKHCLKAFKEKRFAAIVIQKNLRCVIARKNYLLLKEKTVMIQKWWINLMKGSQIRKQFLAYKKAVSTIENFRSVKLQRKAFLKLKSTTIKVQALYRGHRCRRILSRRNDSALKIQHYYRHYRRRVEGQKQHKACNLIQSAWRGYQIRKLISQRKAAATLLQSHFRVLICQKRYTRMRNAALIIQSGYRAYRMGLQHRNSYLAFKKSCITIQSVWRGFCVRKTLQKQHQSATVIQQFFLQFKERREQLRSSYEEAEKCHKWYTQLKLNLIIFQRQARKYLHMREKSAVLIQSYIRRWLAQKSFKREKAALKIQSLWRAYKVRKGVTNKMIISARRKIRKANSNQNDFLGNRTTKALNILLTDTQVGNMIWALQNLNVCTRLSSSCCKRLVASGGISILNTISESCNRSVPHQEMIVYISNILLTLTKYDQTVEDVWSDEGTLQVVFNLMKIFWEKACPIFTKCCTILYVFCQDPKKVKILKETTYVCQQISSFHSRIRRKQKIQEDKRSQSAVFKKRYQAINPIENLVVHPEWELKTSRAVEFKDSFIAINTILSLLELVNW